MRTAIVYSSRYGFTEEVAVKLKEKIEDSVALYSVEEVTIKDIEDADQIIFGCPVYAGKLRRNMVDFMNQHKTFLSEKTVGMYISSLNEFKTTSYLEQSLSKGLINHLSECVYIGYGIEMDKLKLVEKVALRAMLNKEDELYVLNEHALNKLIEKMKKT